MKTVFLVGHLPNPRNNKRLALLDERYGEVLVIYPRRKSQHEWMPPMPQIRHIILELDLPTAQHLFRRWWASQKYQQQVLSLLQRENPDVIHVEGLDSLMIAARYARSAPKKVNVVYEVADLREPLIAKAHNPLEWILFKATSFMERKCIKKVDWLIVTSPKFYETRYSKFFPHNRMVCLLNMPVLKPFQNFIKKSTGDFTVGFIGGIRYLSQMKMLVDAAERVGCRVLFAGSWSIGADVQGFYKYCENKKFVEFTGPYDYNTEIANIYGRVDCVYSVYNADNPNVRIALPNKLYEAVWCHLPIIVAKKTYLAELVAAWGVGIAVDHKSPQELEYQLRKLSTDSTYYQSFCHLRAGVELKIDDGREELYRVYDSFHAKTK
jgi:glycosyltransferase involved in cell wall biosynthesis